MQPSFVKRIQKEISNLHSNQIPYVTLKNFEDIHLLTIEITGAPDTIYENETYALQFRLSSQYPIDAPEVVFIGSVPENEHIYSNGHICLSILYDQWSPALTIESICLSIISLLSSATCKKKPVNDSSYCSISKNKSPKDFRWTYHG